jgi:hypothetical protein
MDADEGTVVVESESVKLFVGQLLNDVRQVQLDGAEAMWELALPDSSARPFLRVWIQARTCVPKAQTLTRFLGGGCGCRSHVNAV